RDSGGHGAIGFAPRARGPAAHVERRSERAMTNFRLHTDGGDEEITHGLRELYMAPDGLTYWNELEARIMARIAEVDLGWWGELGRWARPALVAAAVLVLAAGVAMFRARQAETQTMYENILSPGNVPVETAIRPTLEGDREAQLRYVLAHPENRAAARQPE